MTNVRIAKQSGGKEAEYENLEEKDGNRILYDTSTHQFHKVYGDYKVCLAQILNFIYILHTPGRRHHVCVNLFVETTS